MGLTFSEIPAPVQNFFPALTRVSVRSAPSFPPFPTATPGLPCPFYQSFCSFSHPLFHAGPGPTTAFLTCRQRFLRKLPSGLCSGTDLIGVSAWTVARVPRRPERRVFLSFRLRCSTFFPSAVPNQATPEPSCRPS